MKTFYQNIFCVVLLLLSSVSINAQSITDIERMSISTNMSYYFLARPNDITIKVNITGEVRNPGLYSITKGWRLHELLAGAGGPNLSQRRLQDQRTTRIMISRSTENGRIVIYDETLENMLRSTEEFPIMQSNDWVHVESINNEGFSKRDLITVASVAIGVVNLIITILK